jgi:hypothetical protein
MIAVSVLLAIFWLSVARLCGAPGWTCATIGVGVFAFAWLGLGLGLVMCAVGARRDEL